MANLDSFKDIIITPDKFKIENNYLLKVHNNNQYNKVIIDYYKKYQNEGKIISSSKINTIESCNKYFVLVFK